MHARPFLSVNQRAFMHLLQQVCSLAQFLATEEHVFRQAIQIERELEIVQGS